MARFPHAIRPSKEGRWPRAIAVVSVVGRQSAEGYDGKAFREYLMGWHGAMLIRRREEYVCEYTTDGQDGELWWNALHYATARYSPLWVFSYRACRDWTLLGLWEMIENGYVSVCERQHPAAIRERMVRTLQGSNSTSASWPISAGDVSRMLGDDGGYLVAGDPPNILRARFCEGNQRWQWVDFRNYGVERPSVVTDGVKGLQWAIGAVTSSCRTLHAYKLGSIRATAGSQAMRGWRSNHYTGGVYVGTRRESNAVEQAGHYGGRCEVLRLGTARETVYAGDFASQYCILCRDNVLPTRAVFNGIAGEAGASNPNCSPATLIATVSIETDEPAYPYRRRTDTIYPIGRFVTTLCGPELKDAVGRGRVKRWHSWVEYELGPILQSYSQACLDMRAYGDSIGDTVVVQLAKRLGNTLHGKFGERSKRWVFAPELSTDVQYGEWWAARKGSGPVRCRSIAGITSYETREEWSDEAVPSIAAWVASLGRMALLGAIRAAGWDNVYYYDTDSIFVNCEGRGKLISWGYFDTDRPLSLRNLGQCDYAEFIGIKHYHWKDRYVCAGLPKSGVITQSGPWSYWHTPSPTEQLLERHRPEQVSRLLQFTQSRPYRHGVVGTDGIVTPHVLEEW